MPDTQGIAPSLLARWLDASAVRRELEACHRAHLLAVDSRRKAAMEAARWKQQAETAMVEWAVEHARAVAWNQQLVDNDLFPCSVVVGSVSTPLVRFEDVAIRPASAVIEPEEAA